jgi:hypothetical protein
MARLDLKTISRRVVDPIKLSDLPRAMGYWMQYRIELHDQGGLRPNFLALPGRDVPTES